MKWMISALLFLTLTACGIGLEDSGGGNADREIKNGKLRDEYESVRGTYEGFLRVGANAQKFPVKLFLWTGEVQESPQPGDLKPGVRVVLRGRLMQQQFIGDSDNLIMTGQFDAATGRLRLDPDAEISKTSTGCRLGGQDPITVSGTVSPSKVTGSVLRNGQEWGTLEEMQRTSSDTSSGSVLSEEQEYQRLLATYQPVTGMYSGKLSRRICSRVRDEDFSLWLYVERVQEGASPGGSPCYVPRLNVRTLRNYSGELEDVSYRSINRFDPGSFLPQFTSNVSTLNMDFRDGKLMGQISTSGLWGNFEARRDRDQVVAPQDEYLFMRERLERTFALFTGNYPGKVQPPSGRAWRARLQLYIDEQTINGLRMPALLALYKRTDLSDDTIGMHLMQVSVAIDGCVPTLVMKSEPNGSGSVPGYGLMRFSTEWVNGRMTGQLVDHRGPMGILTVKRQ